ncbi:MAG: zinc ABC transporter substrate-binding protein [Helicobacteraceae bacterium]|jgi:zinc transport system substrate-binding protein|nr:zinc ABC transporter substrate-binding protein [Helicobacteraceae bacterium]
MIRSLFFLLVLGVSFACAKVVVAVSVPPQGWLVKQIGGDKVDVIVIAPQNANADSYSPTQAQITSLAKADIYIACGLGFEKDLLKNAKFDESKIYAADSGFNKISLGDAIGVNTYIWLSYAAMRLQVQTTMRALGGVDPENTGFYQINGMKLIQVLDRVKAQVISLLAPYNGKAFLVYRSALSYIANDYRLRQISVSANMKQADIQSVAQKIKAEGITTMLVPQDAAKEAQALAKTLGVKIETIDVMEEDWEALMHAVAAQLIAVLS